MTTMLRRDNGPMQSPVNDKRGQLRFRNRLPMLIELGSQRLEGNSRNLSLGGTFIETVGAGSSLREGARIRLRFSIPTQPDPIVTDAQVRWTEADGVGVSFGALRAREMWALTKYLGHI
jgi:hypothetical protein